MSRKETTSQKEYSKKSGIWSKTAHKDQGYRAPNNRMKVKKPGYSRRRAGEQGGESQETGG